MKFLLATLQDFVGYYVLYVIATSIFTKIECHSCESRNPFLQRGSFIFLDSRMRENDWGIYYCGLFLWK